LFVNFVVALLMIGGVVAILVNVSKFKGGQASALPVALGIILLGVGSLLVVPRVERPLDCADDPSLAASYRTRFFVRVAFSEAAALLGFVGFMLSSRWWMYPLGALFAAVGFARLAPTASTLARDEERLNDCGCFRSLVAALATLRPPGGPRSPGS
jgi:hypothetical protein